MHLLLLHCGGLDYTLLIGVLILLLESGCFDHLDGLKDDIGGGAGPVMWVNLLPGRKTFAAHVYGALVRVQWLINTVRSQIFIVRVVLN